MKPAALLAAAGVALGVLGGASDGRAGFDEPGAKAVAPASRASEAAAPAQSTDGYVRTHDDDARGTVSLELAIRSFRKADGTGPIIYLVSAVHIADLSFYHKVQEFLDRQDVVLFEGVKPPGSDVVAADATEAERAQVTRARAKILVHLAERLRASTKSWPQTIDAVIEKDGRFGKLMQTLAVDGWGRPFQVQLAPAPHDRDGSPTGEETFVIASLGSDGAEGGAGSAADIAFQSNRKNGKAESPNIQSQLADALGLTFQLDGMDSTKANWRSSDMSMDELQRRLDAQGGDASVLLSMLDGSSMMAKLAGMFMGMIKLSPDLQLVTKVMMVEVLANADTMMGDGEGNSALGPMAGLMKVIVEDRNEVVVNDIRRVMESEPGVKSIAAFYGAGHMNTLEQRLVKELKVKRTGEEWMTAITVSTKGAGMGGEQLKMMRLQMKAQIAKQLQGAKAKSKAKKPADGAPNAGDAKPGAERKNDACLPEPVNGKTWVSDESGIEISYAPPRGRMFAGIGRA
ncbi:hypothetical protein BH11PLA1_BH11PLA1_15600 [soil metagenome]